jgi:flagellar basal-body rod modification protein FlgD
MNIAETGWSPSPVTTDSSTTTNSSNKSDELGKQDFLRLLVAQLSQQDPLNPSDPQAFIAQLAQFSSLEQLVTMNGKLDTLASSQTAATSTSMTSLIGKTVVAAGDSTQLDDTSSPTLAFSLSEAATDCTMTVTDSNGQTVRTITLQNCSQGANSTIWDGRDNNGNRLPSGSYHFSVTGKNAQGVAVTATSRFTSVITGVSYDQGSPVLLTGDQKITMSNVIDIM